MVLFSVPLLVLQVLAADPSAELSRVQGEALKAVQAAKKQPVTAETATSLRHQLSTLRGSLTPQLNQVAPLPYAQADRALTDSEDFARALDAAAQCKQLELSLQRKEVVTLADLAELDWAVNRFEQKLHPELSGELKRAKATAMKLRDANAEVSAEPVEPMQVAASATPVAAEPKEKLSTWRQLADAVLQKKTPTAVKLLSGTLQRKAKVSGPRFAMKLKSKADRCTLLLAKASQGAPALSFASPTVRVEVLPARVENGLWAQGYCVGDGAMVNVSGTMPKSFEFLAIEAPLSVAGLLNGAEGMVSSAD